MFKITESNSSLFSYLNHFYQVYKPKKDTLNHIALNRLFLLNQTMLSIYSRVFVIRIDLHPKVFSVDNQVMSSFLRKINKKLEKKYKCQIGYFCAREQGSSDKQHYHLALMLSGHKIRAADNLLSIIQADWSSHCQGSAHFVSNPYYMMLRGDKSSINPVMYRLSYLTKNFTKEHNGLAKSYLCNVTKLRRNFESNVFIENLLVNPFITHKNFNYYDDKKLNI